MTRSASRSSRSIAYALDAMVRTRPPNDGVRLAQPRQRDVEDRRRRRACRPRSQPRAARRRRRRARRPSRRRRRAPRRAADPGAALVLHQVVGAHLGRQPAGDLAHRRQQRAATGRAAATVSYAMEVVPGGQQRVGGRAVGREVQVGEQHEVVAQVAVLRGDRLLDLADEVSARPDLGGVADDGRTGRQEVVVADRRAHPGTRLDEHLVPGRDQLMHPGGREGDAVLAVLDLAGDADLHAWGSVRAASLFRPTMSELPVLRRVTNGERFARFTPCPQPIRRQRRLPVLTERRSGGSTTSTGDILRELERDGRISNKELAALVGVAPSTCHARVRALRESGVLRGFHAQVDPEAVGRGLQAMIAVRLQAAARVAAHGGGAPARAASGGARRLPARGGRRRPRARGGAGLPRAAPRSCWST